MVLGLGAAVCFVLLVIYIVVKVHFCKKETQKNNKSSTISHDTLKNPPSTTSPAYPIDSFNKNWYTDEQVPDQMQSEPNVWPYSFICRTQIMLQKAICFFTVLPSSLNRLLPSVFWWTTFDWKGTKSSLDGGQISTEVLTNTSLLAGENMPIS